ncbi:MAG: BACON domain-containing protein, partial [Alistipes sp.]|nr:BACON domain-containing protein [Alistipes sp.]
MKKILFIIAMLIGVVACDIDKPAPEPKPDTRPVLTITSEGSLWFEAEGGEGVITYTLENPVKGVELEVVSSVEWIEATAGQAITYVVATNELEEERRGTITVSYGEYDSFSVSIMQRANFDADVVFEAKTLNGSYYFDMVEGATGYSYNLMISDKGLNQSGLMYDDASYYIFDLYAATGAVDGVATIPAGEYTLGIEKKAGVINDGYSRLVQTTSKGTTSLRYSEVRLVVGDQFIEAFITLENDEVHYLKYEGSLAIDFYEADNNSGFSTLRRDYYFDINDGLFVGAYVGNMYYSGADTCQVYLFEELDLETGEEFGDEFQLDLQLPRGGTDICGTYTPGTSAGHFLIGTMEDLGGGQYMQTNTWYMTAGYLDFAPLVDGKIIVEKDSNDVYTFTIDCVDDEGHKISGKFRGTGQ